MTTKRGPGDVEPNEEEAQRLARLLLASAKHPRDYPEQVTRFVKIAHHDKSDAYAEAMARRVRQICEWAAPSPARPA